MKRPLLTLLFLMALTATKAQDRIITIQNDTIECRIVSVGDARIIYEQASSEDYAVGKSMAISDVQHYYRSSQSDFKKGNDWLQTALQMPEHPYLFTLQGGLARSFTDYGTYKEMLIYNGIPASQASDYIEKLKNGFHINAGFHYLVFKNMGFGVDYSFFYSSSDKDFLINAYNDMNLPLFVTISQDEKIYTHFIGFSFLFQQFPGSKGKFKITETLSPGLASLRNETRSNQYNTYWHEDGSYYTPYKQYYDQFNAVTSGTAFGVKGGLSVEYCILPQVSAGLAGNFVWAKLRKVSYKDANNEFNNEELEKALDISHLDYGLTVRYSF